MLDSGCNDPDNELISGGRGAHVRNAFRGSQPLFRIEDVRDDYEFIGVRLLEHAPEFLAHSAGAADDVEADICDACALSLNRILPLREAIAGTT
jgi:hypothetical protein